MPCNIPALLARMPRTEQTSSEMQEPLDEVYMPPNMSSIMRRNGLPDYPPKTGPQRPNSRFQRPNAYQGLLAAQLDGPSEQEDDFTGSIVEALGASGLGSTEKRESETAASGAQEETVQEKGQEASTAYQGLEPPAQSGVVHADDGSTAILQPSPNAYEKSHPMKHLTCYFWKVVGKCKYREANCLYAHRETGHVANAPILVEPGNLIFAHTTLELLH